MHRATDVSRHERGGRETQRRRRPVLRGPVQRQGLPVDAAGVGVSESESAAGGQRRQPHAIGPPHVAPHHHVPSRGHLLRKRAEARIGRGARRRVRGVRRPRRAPVRRTVAEGGDAVARLRRPRAGPRAVLPPSPSPPRRVRFPRERSSARDEGAVVSALVHDAVRAVAARESPLRDVRGRRRRRSLRDVRLRDEERRRRRRRGTRGGRGAARDQGGAGGEQVGHLARWMIQ
mmetsp:Transcript_15608/g.56078  ORF Transcript_15608/g.56078 Transcript_15608/m.56078 type:complete len:232 (-) Transcript_15608:896-1591(-)